MPVFLFLVVIVTTLSLIPNPPVPQKSFPGLDKIEHILAYAALGFFFMGVLSGTKLRTGRSFLLVLLFSLIYGGGIELLQGVLGRNRELADLAADFLGSALGAGFYRFLSRRFSS